MSDVAFWQAKTFAQMSQDEWESLCDGCGKCCLNKLQDADTDELLFTNIACEQLNLDNCRCKVYAKRTDYVPDCVTLTPDNVQEVTWLPATCAYRLLAEGKALPDWHPLVSGDPDTVHQAQISVLNKAVSEADVHQDDWDLYIIDDLS